MADVIARWLIELPLQGGDWQMLWPAGRCYLPGQFFNFSSEMLNRTHPKCVADGICQYFYSGMDH